MGPKGGRERQREMDKQKMIDKYRDSHFSRLRDRMSKTLSAARNFFLSQGMLLFSGTVVRKCAPATVALRAKSLDWLWPCHAQVVGRHKEMTTVSPEDYTDIQKVNQHICVSKRCVY